MAYSLSFYWHYNPGRLVTQQFFFMVCIQLTDTAKHISVKIKKNKNAEFHRLIICLADVPFFKMKNIKNCKST